MDIRISHYTAQGRRESNQDAYTFLESRSGFLAVVADGLGGMSRGEVASAIAVESMDRQLRKMIPDEDTLIDAIREASREIDREQEPHAPMRTTVAALWIGDGEAYAANVGDTRIYQFRGGQIIFQSPDHSVAQMAVLVGELPKDQLRSSPDRNRLIRALGNPDPPKVASSVLQVQPGDRFLLCSDGFWEPVLEENMLSTLAHSQTVGQWLGWMKNIVESANDPTQDNHTAIAIAVEGYWEEEITLR